MVEGYLGGAKRQVLQGVVGVGGSISFFVQAAGLSTKYAAWRTRVSSENGFLDGGIGPLAGLVSRHCQRDASKAPPSRLRGDGLEIIPSFPFYSSAAPADLGDIVAQAQQKVFPRFALFPERIPPFTNKMSKV